MNSLLRRFFWKRYLQIKRLPVSDAIITMYESVSIVKFFCSDIDNVEIHRLFVQRIKTDRVLFGDSYVTANYGDFNVIPPSPSKR